MRLAPRITQLLVWGTAGLIALLAASIDAPGVGGGALAILCLALGVWMFWSHGGPRITGAAVWGLAFAILAGYAGAYALWIDKTPVATDGLLGALAVVYFSQVALWGLFWCQSLPRVSPVQVEMSASTGRWSLMMGAGLLVPAVYLAIRGVGADVTSLEDSAGPVVLVSATAFVGATMVAALFLLGSPGTFGRLRWVLAAPAVVLYAAFVFRGGGRLTLVALGIAIALMAGWRLRGRQVKTILLLASVPAMFYFSVVGQARLGSNDPRVFSEVTGLESVTNPLQYFAVLLELEEDGRLPRAWGSTFVASATGLVPRSWWQEKPLGLGATLVPILAPESSGTNLSLAALYHGEWLLDFGYVGLLLMIPCIGLFIGRLDRALHIRANQLVISRPRLVVTLMCVVLVAGLGDFVWAGTFTYATRAGARIFVLFLILLVAKLIPPIEATAPPQVVRTKLTVPG